MASYTTEILRIASALDRAQRRYDNQIPDDEEDVGEERVHDEIESMVNKHMEYAIRWIHRMAKLRKVGVEIEDSGMNIRTTIDLVTAFQYGTEGTGNREINIVFGDNAHTLDLVGEYSGVFEGDEDGVTWVSNGIVTCTLEDGKGHKLWHHRFVDSDIENTALKIVAELTKVLGK